MTVPTTHCKDDGPVEGYVYLVLRDDKMSVKIGSTIYTPSMRFSSTPDCHRDNFLLACWTTSVRELEHYLHSVYRGIGLPGKDNFALNIEHIIALSRWFDGGVFSEEQGGDDGNLTLVDRRGNPPGTGWARAELIGRAVRLANGAEFRRRVVEEERQEDARRSLWSDWERRAAKSWGVARWDVKLGLMTGKIDPYIAGVRKSIAAGHSARVPRRPPVFDEPRVVGEPEDSGAALDWLIAFQRD